MQTPVVANTPTPRLLAKPCTLVHLRSSTRYTIQTPVVADLVFLSQKCLVPVALVSLTHLVACALFNTVIHIERAVQRNMMDV